MERGNWSIEALNELTYIDSLDSYDKASALVRWNKKYLTNNSISDFELERDDLKRIQELLFKSIKFLKEYKEETRLKIVENRKMRKFMQH